MTNPKHEKVCRECEVSGSHYTTREGYVRNPCVACLAKRRSDWWKIAKQDPERLAEVRSQQRKQASSEKGRARQRAYLKTEKGKAVRKRYAKSEKSRARDRARCAENRARAAVKRALAEGTLTRPTECNACGGKTPHTNNPDGLEAHHHKGYAKENRLEVRWLCVPCHRAVHEARMGLGGGARWHGDDRSKWPPHIKGSESGG